MHNTGERIGECFDGLAERYEDLAPRHEYFAPSWIPRHTQDIEAIVQCEVLDLGCGTGLNAKALCDHREGIRATGVDVSPKMLERARANNRYHRLYAHDLAQCLPADILSGTFDLVVALSVFEYLTDGSTFLSECHRVLKYNGTLWTSFRRFEAEDEGSPPRHVSFNGIDITHHSAGEILHMMQRTGFNVIGIDAVSGFITRTGFSVPYYVVRARKTQ